MTFRSNFFLFIALSSLIHPSIAQGQSTLDSLKAVYRELSASEEKFAALIRILQFTPERAVNTFEHNEWLAEGEQLAQRYPDQAVSLDYFLYRKGLAIERANYETGYAYGLRALSLARKLEMPEAQTEAAYGIAFAISEYDPAASLPYYLECIRLSRITGDSTSLADCLIDYSDSYSLSDDYNEATYLEIINEARLISEALQLGEQRMTNYTHHIVYHIEKNDLEAARSFLLPLRKLADSLAKNGDPAMAYIYFDMKASILAASGEYDAAIPIAERILDSMLAYQELANVDQQYESLIDLYEQAGRYEASLELMQEYLEFREDVFAMDKRMLVSQLDAQFRTSEKDRLIESQRSSLAQANQHYLILGGAALLFGGLLILVNYQSTQISRSNAELSSLTAEVKEQNDRLNTLLGELHHRVKNNLQLISSLLRLQARKTSDQSVKSALSVGHQRVEAMSIIHQRLYQQENLTVVDIPSVFKELLQRTDFAYRPKLQPIKTELQLDVRQLDAIQAVPLTLIVNELVTNSFKYAFTEQAEPIISIRLEQLSTGKLYFQYSDNGPGITMDQPNATGFGTQLIHSLSGQLGGQADFFSDGAGAHFRLAFGASK